MIFFLLFSLLGLADSSYLTWEHYQHIIPPCTVNRFIPILTDCGKVLTSQYSMIFGIPVALTGVLHYLVLTFLFLMILFQKNKFWKIWALFQSLVGAVFSLYFMYLQIVVIRSICLYCTLSALISFTVFFLIYKKLTAERLIVRFFIYGFIYQKIIKPVFFLFDAEFIHNQMINFGEILGRTS